MATSLASSTALLRLPLDPSDALLTQKQAVLRERQITLEFSVHDLLAQDTPLAVASTFDDVLQAARLVHLNETELYFLEDGDVGPFSPRNETQSLWLLHSLLSVHLKDSSSCETHAQLQGLLDKLVARLDADREEFEGHEEKSGDCGPAEKYLRRWVVEEGAIAQVEAANFDTTGQGLAASKDLEVGDLVLQIPVHLLLCEDTALASEMGPALRALQGVEGDTLALLWSMRELHDEDAPHAAYWRHLPPSFSTGLSFPPEVLVELDGTLLLDEMMLARQHLRQQYDALFPALSEAMPSYFPSKLYSWPLFLYAAELWYSHAIQVRFPDGSTKSCLIPVADLANHALYPHVTSFSRVEVTSKALQLQLDLLEDDLSSARRALLEEFEIPLLHHLPAQGSATEKLNLPSRLLGALRVLNMGKDELCTFHANPRYGLVSQGNERAAVGALEEVLDVLLHRLVPAFNAGRYEHGDTPSGGLVKESWKVLAAQKFKQAQVASLKVLQACCSAWRSDIEPDDSI
eukprot:SM000267S09852  [mRNA]  locus=s267:48799:52235:+ [translate_table: standard]